MRLPNLYIFLTLICIIILASACQQEDYTGKLPDKVDFNFHIRPILSNNCYLCHGPDASSREADLRLDLEETATALLENGNRPIHAGNWKKSEIIQRIISNNPDIQMPPPEIKNRLSKKEVALLKKWINQGAEWKEYWAFIPPTLPENKNFNELKKVNEKIDFFIDKELDYNNLSSSEKANKSALIRRLSYILTGLPPTTEEVENFIGNQDSDAYEKLVDRLLDSPHYGERWARHWMDLARFAEYKGHEFDFPVLGAWQYRDYLTRAFNLDLPYDQFIKEQLAGDLIKKPRLHPENGTNESIHGTAFFTFGECKHSPVDIRQEEADYIDNMIDVTTKTFQGLTVGCARCHDHKFDPIPTTDYYSLYGMMESTRFALIPSNTSLASSFEKVDSIVHIKEKMRALIAGASKEKKDLSENGFNRKKNQGSLETIEDNSAPNTIAKQSNFQKILTKTSVVPNADIIVDFREGTLKNWVSNGLAFNNQNALGKPIFDKNDQLIKLESGKASSRILGTGIQGALRSPTFIIKKEKLLVKAAGVGSMIRIIIDNFQLIQNPIYGGLHKILDQPNLEEYEFDLSMLKGHKAYIELLPATFFYKEKKGHFYSFKPNAWIEVEYAYAFDGEKPTDLPLKEGFLVENSAKAVQNWMAGNANPKEIELLNQLIKNGEWKYNKKEIILLKEQLEQLALSLYDSTFFQGVTEGDIQFSPVFIRGSIKELSKEKIPHRFFTALKDYSPTFPDQGSGRMELANGIASPNNPLTSRVMVNRIWHHLFGRGIVETVDNFGLQGKLPSHSELLDFLAIQFVKDGWSMKKIIKNIALSDAFQRSTIAVKGVDKIDPSNINLSHFPVRRLEGEAIRDGLLAVSGRLDRQLYGEPFEINLTPFMKGRGRPWVTGSLDGEGRRSIYQAIRRNFLPPFMLTFDMPAPFSTFGKRNVSNVPAQSLTLMNAPFVLQQAAFWAERINEKETTFEQRIKDIYLNAFSRKPSQKELEEAQLFFKEQSEIYDLIREKGKKDIRVWTDYCHSIFMMKEFIYLVL